jgi:hypothetical protein
MSDGFRSCCNEPGVASGLENLMPVNLQIVRTSDFLKLDAKGQLDLQQSHDVLASVAKSCVDHGIDCALLDVRDAATTMKLADLHALAKAFHEMGFNDRHRLAVLHRYAARERAEIFTMFATDRGWNVRAFEEYEEAINWFSRRIVDVS